MAEWRACVHPGGGNEEYYIQFQVWRPTGTEGCYELVGYNEPPLDDRHNSTNHKNGILSGILSPVEHCVELIVRENEQIDFQPGDVVGYYVDRFRNDNDEDRDGGGIQWIEDNEVVVRYRDGLSKQDIKSQYALNGPNPTECGFPVSDSDSYTLSDASSRVPIISLSLGNAYLSLVFNSFAY